MCRSPLQPRQHCHAASSLGCQPQEVREELVLILEGQVRNNPVDTDAPHSLPA
ncbi:hypothetical protein BIWAKO_03853 [Bosea sp. BIWAKO-01]|nr:hypothetical protein BIWAKO_03853 [Bosea sp. BIWAKO-01]